MSSFDPQPPTKNDMSPPNKKQKTTGFIVDPLAWDSENDSGSDLFEGVIPDTPQGFHTQPTQIIDRGGLPPQRMSSPSQNLGSSIQVPASSPFNGRGSSPLPQPQKRTYTQYNSDSPHGHPQPTVVSLMAPAGTAYRPPHGVISRPPPQQIAKPVVIDLEEDDDKKRMRELFDGDISSDDEISEQAAIKPSTFNTKPPAQSSFGASLNRFQYNQQAQAKPERAQPVGRMPSEAEIRSRIAEMKLVFPMLSYDDCRDWLSKSNWVVDDALARYTDAASRGTARPKAHYGAAIDLTGETDHVAIPQMKRGLVGPQQSLRDKYSSTQAISAPVKHFDLTGDQQPRPKKKLMQGRRNPEPSSPMAVPSPARVVSKGQSIAAPPPQQANYDSYDSDDSGQGSEPEDDPEKEAECLNFFNTGTARDIVDMTNTTQENAEAVVAARPFKTLEKVRLVESAKVLKSGKKSKRAAIGDKIVDTAMQMMNGYQAVDDLVKSCDEIAKPIRAEMATWGLKVQGLSGELELTSFDEDHDSGIGSPVSAAASTKGEDDGDVKTAKKRTFNHLKKPELMADDCVLKDYQVVGLNWLAMMYRQKNSCILADEMGLGKTCQVIAFLSHLVETGHHGPHLVVCPGSTLENWSRELKRFAPNLNIELYWGGQADRAVIGEEMIANRDKINVLVTTYDMAYKPSDNKLLRELRPEVCVYDEGHLLKNPKSKRYASLIKIPAEQRLLLTGTPLQNNLQELAALLAFIMPKVFKKNESELEFIFKSKATTRDADHAALLSAQRIERARSMLTPFVLRRKKVQVLKHMPAKTNRVQFCDIHADQKKIYDGHIDAAKARALARAEGTKLAKSDEANPLMQLRKAAIHPLLFRRHFTDTKIERMADLLRKKEPEEFPSSAQRKHLIAEMHSFNDFGLHQWCLNYPCISEFRLPGAAWMDSGKVDALLKLLEEYKANGDRVLIFSQFTLVLNILEAVLNDSLIAFSRIDGDTPIDHRQSLIDNFTNDESITAFLLTTKAGGTGINLASANKVIIFDMSFNPQDDKQAENRAHRVGQTREVEVVCLVTKDTIEEQIWGLGQSKLKLDGRVAGEEGAGDDDEAGEAAIAKSFLDATSKVKKEDVKREMLKGDNVKTEGNDVKKEEANKKPVVKGKQSTILAFAK